VETHHKSKRKALGNGVLTQIRGFSWHNNKIKMIRSGYYSSNNFQDSNLYLIIKYARVPWFGYFVRHFAKKPYLIM
jgi:hypothetical protein